MQGVQIQALVKKLRSHMPCDVTQRFLKNCLTTVFQVDFKDLFWKAQREAQLFLSLCLPIITILILLKGQL